MTQILLSASLHAASYLLVAHSRRNVHLIATATPLGRRVTSFLTTCLMVTWSVIGALSLLTLMSVDFGAKGLALSKQVMDMAPLLGSFLALVHAGRFAKLRRLQNEVTTRVPYESGTSQRFEDLLRACQKGPSPHLLEELMKMLNSPPRTLGRYRTGKQRRRYWDDFDR